MKRQKRTVLKDSGVLIHAGWRIQLVETGAGRYETCINDGRKRFEWREAASLTDGIASFDSRVARFKAGLYDEQRTQY